MDTVVTARPIVKWVGGKTKLLPELLARLPATYGRYYEPFAGGAALFFWLAPERAVLNDLNADLIGMYRALAVDVEAVIRESQLLAAYHDEGHYARIRARWNDERETHPPRPFERAAMFLYLNRACFNGLWRVNSKGEMNAPLGRRADGSLNAMDFDIDNLRTASAALERAEIRCGSYASAVADAEPGDLVYFDPPYVPASTTASFTSYTAGGFGSDDQRSLAELARSLVERGVNVLLSNSDTPLVRQIYNWARIDVVQRPGTVSSKGAKRGKVDEVIIVGTPAPRRARSHAREQMDLLTAVS